MITGVHLVVFAMRWNYLILHQPSSDSLAEYSRANKWGLQFKKSPNYMYWMNKLHSTNLADCVNRLAWNMSDVWASEFIDWYLMSCWATNWWATSGISNIVYTQGWLNDLSLKKWKSGDECQQQLSSVEVPTIGAPLICNLLIMAQIKVNQERRK